VRLKSYQNPISYSYLVTSNPQVNLTFVILFLLSYPDYLILIY